MVASKKVEKYTFTDQQYNYTCDPGIEIYPLNNLTVFDSKTIPLVFVHGWTASMAGHWWKENNNIIASAVQEYFVSCVNLNPSNSIQVNALLLKNQLLSIQTNYSKISGSVKTLTLVCHSKGGLDAQGFIYYHADEAKKLINKVITLSTPFWGSPLCDLIYHAEKIYIQKFSKMLKDDISPATKNLTTEFCQTFRTSYDSLSTSIPFYTVSGIGTNGKKAIYNGIAKEFMNYFGPNDDDVHYKSAETPGGYVIAILPYHHNEITLGNKIWNIIDPYISEKMNKDNALYQTAKNETFKIQSSEIDKALAASAMVRTWMYWVFLFIGVVVLYYVIKYIYNKIVSKSQQQNTESYDNYSAFD